MAKILITGCSTGFGLATATLFLEKGWDVVATMRDISANQLASHERLTVFPLDITSETSIKQALDATGPVDALINNAGIGLLNALEGYTTGQIRDVVETNLIGTILMTQAVLPGMRAQKSGVIVNVSSSVTTHPLPALSVYSSTKAAVNAFTQSLALEAALFGIRARLVLPGASPSTAFAENAFKRMGGLNIPAAYDAFVTDYIKELQGSPLHTDAGDVANAVWRAVTDEHCPMLIPAGKDAIENFKAANINF